MARKDHTTAGSQDGNGGLQSWGSLVQVSALVHSDRFTKSGPDGIVSSHTTPDQYNVYIEVV